MVAGLSSRLALTIGLSLVACAAIGQPSGVASEGLPSDQSKAVSVYREPSSWFLHLIQEFFDDIDWPAIAYARKQIEKFIRKAEKVWSVVKIVANNGKNKYQADSTATNSTHSDSLRSDSARLFTSGWWSKISGAGSKPAGTLSDPPNIKEMLERVACFVGYVRLMNLSNEALKELDASKAISSFFSSSKTSAGGYLSSLFG